VHLDKAIKHAEKEGRRHWQPNHAQEDPAELVQPAIDLLDVLDFVPSDRLIDLSVSIDTLVDFQ